MKDTPRKFGKRGQPAQAGGRELEVESTVERARAREEKKNKTGVLDEPNPDNPGPRPGFWIGEPRRPRTPAGVGPFPDSRNVRALFLFSF